MSSERDDANVLTSALIRVRLTDGSMAACSLPDLYALMMADRVEAITALRPHQKHPLHAFLAQVGALALMAAGRTEVPDDAATWCDLLRGLTPEHPDDAPWTLVVTDLARPAFMQPPVPEGSLEGWNSDFDAPSPDSLDIFTAGRLHDLKTNKMITSEMEDWMFSLISLQTISAQNGAPNKAAARSPTGNSFRSFVGIVPPGGAGARLKRDIGRLLEIFGSGGDVLEGYSENGQRLLWLNGWDGKKQIQRAELHPYYVEVCRRVRLVRTLSGVISKRTGSDRDRILEPEGLEGRTGDPWMPLWVGKDGARPMQVYEDGFHYSRISTLLRPNKSIPAPLQLAKASDGKFGLMLEFSGIGTRRGRKGVLGGFHVRQVFVRPALVAFFAQQNWDRVAQLSEERVDAAKKILNEVLKPALLSLYQNATKKLDSGHTASNKKADIFLAALDREIDRTFFEDLFDELAEDVLDKRTGIRKRWLLRLKTHAEDQLATAEAGSPLSLVRRYQSRAAAEDRLQRSFFTAFAPYFPKTESPTP